MGGFCSLISDLRRPLKGGGQKAMGEHWMESTMVKVKGDEHNASLDRSCDSSAGSFDESWLNNDRQKFRSKNGNLLELD